METRFDKTPYADPAVADAAFLVFRQITESGNQSEKSAYQIANKTKNELTRAFSGLMAKDIDIKCAKELLNSFQKSLVCRVLIELSKSGVLDEKFSRLEKFKTRLLDVGTKSDVMAILKADDDRYERFLAERDDSMAETLFFTNLEDIDFLEENVKALTEDFFQKIKEGEGDCRHRYAKCVYVKRMAKTFETTPIGDLDREKVLGWKNKTTVPAMLEYLEVLRPLLPDDVLPLFSLSGIAKAHLPFSKFKAFCESDSPKQFSVIEEEEGYRLVYLDVPKEYPLYDDLLEYVQNHRLSYNLSPVSRFYESCGNKNIKSAADLDFGSFMSSVNFYAGKQRDVNIVCSVYCFLYQKYEIEFFEKENIPAKTLYSTNLGKKLADGYVPVRYAPGGSLPEADKWILCYDKKNDSGTCHSFSETSYVKFDVENETFKGWCKQYFWLSRTAMRSRIISLGILEDFFNYITDLREGRVLTTYAKPSKSKNDVPTAGEVLAYRMYLFGGKSPNYAARTMSVLKTSLQFLKYTGVANFSSSMFFHMRGRKITESGAQAIPDEKLKNLAAHMAKKAKSGLEEDLYFSVFKLLLQTEFRVGEILELEENCIEELPEGFCVNMRRKDPTTEMQKMPIAENVKEELDHVKEVTENLRNMAVGDMQKFLFLKPGRGTTPVLKVSRNLFKTYLQKCCGELGFPKYSTANLRDTHMTKAEGYMLAESLSDLEAGVLTGHKNRSTTLENYYDMPLPDMIRSMEGVVVGDFTLDENGDLALPKEENTCQGCGPDKVFAKCLLCENFVALPEDLEFFKEQEAKALSAIKAAKTKEERKEAKSFAKLFEKYIKGLEDLNVC